MGTRRGCHLWLVAVRLEALELVLDSDWDEVGQRCRLRCRPSTCVRLANCPEGHTPQAIFLLLDHSSSAAWVVPALRCDVTWLAAVMAFALAQRDLRLGAVVLEVAHFSAIGASRRPVTSFTLTSSGRPRARRAVGRSEAHLLHHRTHCIL